MDLLFEIFGWIGSLSYSIYCFPQAYDAFKKGKTDGLSLGMILLLFGGSSCSLAYVFPDYHSPLFYNFFIGLCSHVVLLYYRLFPRKV